MNSDYERYDGEIQLNNIIYKYVYRKVCNDTVYLKCLANKVKMQLESQKNELTKNNIDIVSENTSGKSSSGHHHPQRNALDFDITHKVSLPYYFSDGRKNNYFFNEKLFDVFQCAPFLPPDHFA